MPKNINCITITITLEGIEKMKTGKKKLTATQSEEYFFDQRILRKDVTKSGNGEPGTGNRSLGTSFQR